MKHTSTAKRRTKDHAERVFRGIVGWEPLSYAARVFATKHAGLMRAQFGFVHTDEDLADAISEGVVRASESLTTHPESWEQAAEACRAGIATHLRRIRAEREVARRAPTPPHHPSAEDKVIEQQEDHESDRIGTAAKVAIYRPTKRVALKLAVACRDVQSDFVARFPRGFEQVVDEEEFAQEAVKYVAHAVDEESDKLFANRLRGEVASISASVSNRAARLSPEGDTIGQDARERAAPENSTAAGDASQQARRETAERLRKTAAAIAAALTRWRIAHVSMECHECEAGTAWCDCEHTRMRSFPRLGRPSPEAEVADPSERAAEAWTAELLRLCGIERAVVSDARKHDRDETRELIRHIAAAARRAAVHVDDGSTRSSIFRPYVRKVRKSS